MAKLSVHLVTWNGSKYVPFLFESLRKQIFHDWKFYILDNASSDGMAQAMKQELNNFPVQYELIEHPENSGFAGGHNILFQKTQSDYIVLLNQDMVLQPDCLEKITRFLDAHSDVAVVSPRLMKWDFAAKEFTDSVDALGLKVFRNRRVIEKYTGKQWSMLKPKMNLSFRAERFRDGAALEVFGVSGALPAFRRSAVQEVAFSDGTIFDSNYHVYKEDVDLAFRLRSAGHRSFVLLEAVAYHDRSAAGPEQMDDRTALENKKKQSEWVKYHSYKNHLMTLYKNEYWQNLLLDFPWIFWYELKKFVYFLVWDRKVLQGLSEVSKSRKELATRRQEIQQKRRATWKEMRGWWM